MEGFWISLKQTHAELIQETLLLFPGNLEFVDLIFSLFFVSFLILYLCSFLLSDWLCADMSYSLGRHVTDLIHSIFFLKKIINLVGRKKRYLYLVWKKFTVWTLPGWYPPLLLVTFEWKIFWCTWNMLLKYYSSYLPYLQMSINIHKLRIYMEMRLGV